MGAPTRDQVAKWDVGPLGDTAGADKIVQQINNDADSMHRAIDGLGWSGKARNAADARADREKQQMRKVAAAVEDYKDARVAGARTMGPMITDLNTGRRNLEGDHFDVAQDWKVTDKHNYTAAYAAAGDNATARAQVDTLKQQRTNEAANETVRLQRTAAALGDESDKCGKAIAKALDQVKALTPETAGLSGAQADSDVKAVKDGHPTPQQLRRLQAATQLTPDQKKALAEGKPVNMTRGQWDYLRELMRDQDGMSVPDIAKLGANLPPDQAGQVHAAVANGMQIMSNPNVHTSGALAGDKPVTLDSGGMNQLPTQVRTLVTENPVQTWTTTVSTNDGGMSSGSKPASGINIPRSGDFKALDNLLGAGDKSVAQGTDLDRGLIKQGAEIAGATKDPSVFVGPPSNAWGGSAYDDANQLANTMLDRASGDHAAIHDALTGHNMQVTTPGGTYNATDHIDGLINHDWNGHEQGISHLIDTIGDNATSPTPLVNTEAGESAHALAQYVGSHHNDLMNVVGGGHELGQVDPGMTQALGGTLSHYIPNMVGVDPGLLHSHGFDAMHSGDVRGLFQVIDSNHDAAVGFNQAAYSSISQLDQQFGLHGGQDYSLGQYAGRIDWAAQNGMNDELAHRIQDSAQRAHEQAQLFDAVKTGATFGIGKIPTIGSVANLGINLAAPEVKDWLLGSVPVEHGQVDLSQDGSMARNYYEVLKGMSMAPNHAGLAHDPNVAEYFNPDGSLKPYDDIAAGGRGPDSSLPDLTTAVQHLLPHIDNWQDQYDAGSDPDSHRKSEW